MNKFILLSKLQYSYNSPLCSPRNTSLNFLKAACAKSDATGVVLAGELAVAGLLGVSTDALAADVDAVAAAVWLDDDAAPPSVAFTLSPDTSPLPDAPRSADVLARGTASESAIVPLMVLICLDSNASTSNQYLR